MNLLLESTVKASVILGIVLAASFVLRRQSAAFRHWLLALALIAAAAQPAMMLLLPAWTMPTSPASMSAAQPPESTSPEMTFEVVLPSQAASASGGTDWRTAAMVVWIAGALINIAVLGVGIMRLAWLRSASRPASAVWRDEEEILRAELGLRRPVQLGITAHPALLVAWGIRRPTILLPVDAAAWTRDRVRIVLAHELAHVRRADWIVQCGAELARAIYWFNPLFWIACARLRQESEYACDDIVLALGVDRTSYAAHLVDLARGFSAHGRTWLPAPAVARPSTLQRRVRAMLNPHLNRRPIRRAARGAIAVALLCVALPVAGLALQSESAIGGTVRDSSGRTLANATVRLSPVNTDTVTPLTTDASGRFRFSGLAAGEYLLTARAGGFSPLRQNVRVSARETLDLPLTLQVGTLQETITVTSGPPRPAGSVSGGYAQPAPPTCTPSSTGGQIVPPRKLRDVKPRYDERLANVKGTVILDARIGVDGKVGTIDVISGVHPDLEDAAIAAVSQWEFSATYLNCEPVEARMLVSVTFAGAQ